MWRAEVTIYCLTYISMLQYSACSQLHKSTRDYVTCYMNQECLGLCKGSVVHAHGAASRQRAVGKQTASVALANLRASWEDVKHLCFCCGPTEWVTKSTPSSSTSFWGVPFNGVSIVTFWRANLKLCILMCVWSVTLSYVVFATMYNANPMWYFSRIWELKRLMFNTSVRVVGV